MPITVVVTTSPAGVHDLATNDRGTTFYAHTHDAGVRHAERVRCRLRQHQVSTCSNFSTVRQARAFVTNLNADMDAAAAMRAALQ